ncbi:hypothetical protein SUGI_0208710 [Cryptomeria japonica]|nr:hypothetical protein SUGI_0208710 [Cryptomeria japonica]
MLFGKIVRDQRLGIVEKNSEDDVENQGEKWRSESELLKSWVAARQWKVDYFVWSSMFSPGAAMIVTICVAIVAAKVGCRSSNLPFYLQSMSLLLLFCFISSYFSDLVFGSHFVQLLCKFVPENNDYSQYRSILGDKISENGELRTFWIVNRKSFDRIKHRMDDANQQAISSIGFASLREKYTPEFLPDSRQHRMERISHIFSAMANIEIGEDLKDALAAYRERRDVVKFVDFPENIVVSTTSAH